MTHETHHSEKSKVGAHRIAGSIPLDGMKQGVERVCDEYVNKV